MRQSEYRRVLLRQEKARAAKQAAEEERKAQSLWQKAKTAKRWIFFLLVQSLLTNRNK
jgi:hypothetical protein